MILVPGEEAVGASVCDPVRGRLVPLVAELGQDGPGLVQRVQAGVGRQRRRRRRERRTEMIWRWFKALLCTLGATIGETDGPVKKHQWEFYISVFVERFSPKGETQRRN